MHSLLFFLVLALCFACKCTLAPKGTEYHCLPDNCTEAGDIVLSKTNATRVHVGHVTTASSVKIQGNDKLTLIDLTALTTTKEFSIDGNAMLEVVRVAALTTVTVANLDGATLQFAKLSHADAINLVNSNTKYANFPALNFSKVIHVAGNKALGRLELTGLTRSTNITIADNANLTAIFFGPHAEVLSDVTISGNPVLARVFLDKSNKTSAKLTIMNNDALAELDLMSVTTTPKIAISANKALKFVRLPDLTHADSIHISDLITTPKNGCVTLKCFDSVKDFSVFKCGKAETVAPMCAKKDAWTCDCK